MEGVRDSLGAAQISEAHGSWKTLTSESFPEMKSDDNAGDDDDSLQHAAEDVFKRFSR
jgi:hypothetical protein